jgi:hypothetical protein
MSQAVFWSWLRVFAAAAITVLVADVADGGFAGIDWEGIAIAGVVAVGPVILNWLNPNDPRYGRHTPGDPALGQGDPQFDAGRAFE